MLDDALNKKIKEAAEQYHPAYEEGAWKKMEAKLDEQMPREKKKKRRYLLFLPLLLLLTAGIYVLYPGNGNKSTIKTTPASANKNIATSTNTAKSTQDAQDVSPVNKKTQPQPDQLTSEEQNQTAIITQDGSLPAPVKHSDANTNKKISGQSKTTAKIVSGSADNQTVSNNDANNNQTSTDAVDNSSKPNQTINNNSSVTNTDTDLKSNSDNIKQHEPATLAKQDDTQKNNLNRPSEKKPQKKDNSFGKRFGINISAGPDVSAVALNKIGRLALNYGLGFSYDLSNRFTLHSGFYVSDKIYSANKNEYTVPGGGNSTYLSDINANCIVYEIPLAINYNFKKIKNHQWFASAGLSSYLMKKETYQYLYKYPGGYTDQKTWSISNKNQHYFSLLDLSAGYEYFFNKRTSLITEPYLKMPLAGVGAGKVKLSSGGVLFTLRIKPFYKK